MFVKNLTLPEHVAIIMDGNGRWASSRNLDRSEGHKQGAETAKKISIAAQELGIRYLTLYTFSSENWQRPKIEVSNLFSILALYLKKDHDEIHANNIKVSIIGELQNLPSALKKNIENIVATTQYNSGMNLIIAIGYGSRNEIIGAIKKLVELEENIDALSFERYLYTNNLPDPDLLIRTGGDKRLSNFLLWQIAYTELLFIDKYWPDFSEEDFKNGILEFSQRKRRYGK